MNKQKQQAIPPANSGGSPSGGLLGRKLPVKPNVSKTLAKLDEAIKNDEKRKSRRRTKRKSGPVLVCAMCIEGGESPRAARRCYKSGEYEGTMSMEVN